MADLICNFTEKIDKLGKKIRRTVIQRDSVRTYTWKTGTMTVQILQITTKMFSFTKKVDFAGFTLLIPSISVGNVGQLTTDLFIQNLKAEKIAQVSKFCKKLKLYLAAPILFWILDFTILTFFLIIIREKSQL